MFVAEGLAMLAEPVRSDAARRDDQNTWLCQQPSSATSESSSPIVPVWSSCERVEAPGYKSLDELFVRHPTPVPFKTLKLEPLDLSAWHSPKALATSSPQVCRASMKEDVSWIQDLAGDRLTKRMPDMCTDTWTPPVSPRLLDTPPKAPCAKPSPQLLRALEHRSLEWVRQCLEAQPELAALPFFDHDWEPPLCSAIRLGCSAEIVQLLLKYGADVTSIDVEGRTPLVLLSALPWAEGGAAHQYPKPWDFAWSEEALFPTGLDNVIEKSCKERALAIAKLLLQEGADRRGCAEVAAAIGNDHLVELYQGFS